MKFLLFGLVAILIANCGYQRPATPPEFYEECYGNYSPKFVSDPTTIYDAYLYVGVEEWKQVTKIFESISSRFDMFMIDGGTESNYGTDPYESRQDDNWAYHAYFMWVCSSAGFQLNAMQTFNSLGEESNSRLAGTMPRGMEQIVKEIINKDNSRMSIRVIAYKNKAEWRKLVKLIEAKFENVWPGKLERRVTVDMPMHNKSYIVAIDPDDAMATRFAIEKFCLMNGLVPEIAENDGEWVTYEISCFKFVSETSKRLRLMVRDNQRHRIFVTIYEDGENAELNPTSMTSKFKFEFVSNKNREWIEKKPDKSNESYEKRDKGVVSDFIDTLKLLYLFISIMFKQLIG